MDYEKLANMSRVREPTHQTTEHDHALDRIATQMSRVRATMPPRHAAILRAYFNAESYAQAAEEANCTPPTVKSVVNTPKGLRFLSLLQQASELRGGPNLEQRRAMLWRIAAKAEENLPNVAIKAVDTLNRQAGDYQTAEDKDQQVTIVVNNFELPHAPATLNTPVEKDITPVLFEQPIFASHNTE